MKSTIVVTLGGLTCVIPEKGLIGDLSKMGFTHVNGFCLKPGYDYGSGLVLLTREDVNSIVDTRDLTLEIIEFEIDNNNVVQNQRTVTIETVTITETIAYRNGTQPTDLVLVLIADSRFFGVNTPKRLSLPNDLSPASNQDLINEFWNASSTSVGNSLNLIVDLPTNVLRNIQSNSSHNGWWEFCNLIRMFKHDIYRRDDGYYLIKDDYSSPANDAAVTTHSDKLLFARHNLRTISLPEKVRGRFPRKSFGDGIWLTQNIEVSAPGNSIIGHTEDIFFTTEFETGVSVLTEFEEIVNKVASVYFGSALNHMKYNAKYAGVIDFILGPDISEVTYGHELSSGLYTTTIKSIDVFKNRKSVIDRIGSSLTNEVVRCVANEDIGPNGSGEAIVWTDNEPSVQTNPPQPITVFHTWVGRDEKISAGKRMEARLNSQNRWVAVLADCE